MKSILHMKYRNFISGLHILASNQISESILHTDVLSNILLGISQYLLMENKYTLLYGFAVNPYYDKRIFTRVSLLIICSTWHFIYSSNIRKPPFCHSKVFLHIRYQWTGLTIRKQVQLTLKISHPYLLLQDDHFTLLDDNMDRNTIQYDHMYV